jgi:oligopeptide/dipeptide ABC transporter ATP-binding protein
VARILLLQPRIILDEPTSASIAVGAGDGAQFTAGFAQTIFLTHLFTPRPVGVERLSDRVRSYLGRIVESGPARPCSPTPRIPHAHFPAAPRLTGRRATDHGAVRGDPPSAAQVLPGCAFADRCPIADAVCNTAVPQLASIAPGHDVACYRAPAEKFASMRARRRA